MSGNTLASLAFALAAIGLLATPAHAHPIAAPGSEASLATVAETGDVRATYLGTTAAYWNDLYLTNAPDLGVLFNNKTFSVGSTVDLGTFQAGTELVFRLAVQDTGDDFFTGPAARNADAHAHARVQQEASRRTLVSFEDLFGGSFDYNDLSFRLTNTVSLPSGDATLAVPAPALPEPAGLALFAGGLLALLPLRLRRS